MIFYYFNEFNQKEDFRQVILFNLISCGFFPQNSKEITPKPLTVFEF